MKRTRAPCYAPDVSMSMKSIARPVVRVAVQALLSFGVAALADAGVADAAQATEIPSALVISKSSNRNQVHYAVLVDEACTPSGSSPVRPYWRMLEHGPTATEHLSHYEEKVLGIGQQNVEGDAVRVVLRGFPSRPITIQTARSADGRCTAAANMLIAGKPARVESVYVQQSWLGVSYVLLTGRSADGATLQERMKG